MKNREILYSDILEEVMNDVRMRVKLLKKRILQKFDAYDGERFNPLEYTEFTFGADLELARKSSEKCGIPVIINGKEFEELKAIEFFNELPEAKRKLIYSEYKKMFYETFDSRAQTARSEDRKYILGLIDKCKINDLISHLTYVDKEHFKDEIEMLNGIIEFVFKSIDYLNK